MEICILLVSQDEQFQQVPDVVRDIFAFLLPYLLMYC